MLKKTVKSALGIAIASFLTLIVYFFSAVFFQAVGNELTSEDGMNWALFAIMLFCAVIFCLILVWVRHHGNDDSENEFMKEYRDIPYTGIKADISRAVTADLMTYFFAYIIMGLSMVFLMAGIPLAPLVFFMPLMGLMTVLHPILGFFAHLVIFTVLYTFCLCFIRKRWAAGNMSTGTGTLSQNSVNAMRWSAQNRRRWH